MNDVIRVEFKIALSISKSWSKWSFDSLNVVQNGLKGEPGRDPSTLRQDGAKGRESNHSLH